VFSFICILNNASSLIYQLLEYERKLRGDTGSPSTSERSSVLADEEEWGRRRRMLDETSSDPNDGEQESTLVIREAQALDKAMEDRIVARKSSGSSIASSGVGMGPAWRSRYGSRKRSGSIASNMTNGSILSEDLVEEDEEQELLGIGGGFDDDRKRRSPDPSGSSSANSPDDDTQYNTNVTLLFTPATARPPRPPPSAPVWKTSFDVPPATALRSTFDLPTRSAPKTKRRPAPLGLLPPVPSSPAAIIVEPTESLKKATPTSQPSPPFRLRAESRKPAPPPLHLRGSLLKKARTAQPPFSQSTVSTPSQTLFVFPPSPTLTTRTPSTMTLTSNLNMPVPFPSLSTPRVSTFRSHGRTRSFIGLGAPPTPTTACSRVDARGWVGLE
jgi:tyrosine-protein phosphatase